MKPSYENVRSVLLHSGPMTMREVASFFPEVPYNAVASIITALRTKVVTKQVYIREWTREGIGRRYLRAVYDLGNKPDARKPPPIPNAQWLRESRARRRIPKVANSVFAWGQM